VKSPDVNLDVCQVLLSEYLEGYRDYPRTAAGVRRFAFALQENCVSVGHVRAVLKSFEEVFPTVRQIHDVAFGLRTQFETQEDTMAEWRRKYGAPSTVAVFPSDRMAMHWQAFRDMLYYTEGPGSAELSAIQGKEERANDIAFWAAARIRDFDPKWEHADSIAFVRKMVNVHGWPAVMKMTSAPEPMPYTDPNRKKPRQFAQIAAPITQADVQRAEQAYRKTTQEVDREMDSDVWDDPDR
jgi:hypothetical protein